MERPGPDSLMPHTDLKEVMARPRPVYQQELEDHIGVDRRFLCAPASLLHLARAAGHPIEPEQFAANLDFAYWNDVTRGWSRAGLGRMLRDTAGVPSVSWQTAATGTLIKHHDLSRMKRAGYIDSPLETDFLTDIVASLPPRPSGVIELARQGIPVAVTVLPGFASNRAAHAVVLESFDSDTNAVTIFDPDARNLETVYPRELVENYLSPTGACTVVLP